MVNIIKEEIPIEESLKKKLEFICEFAKMDLCQVFRHIFVDNCNVFEFIPIPPSIQEPSHLSRRRRQSNLRFDCLKHDDK